MPYNFCRTNMTFAEKETREIEVTELLIYGSGTEPKAVDIRS